jgi:hypothetical protein
LQFFDYEIIFTPLLMNNRPVADAALQNFQRVSFAGGDRQKVGF